MKRSLRLEVVGLRVTNLQRSLRFYTKALGLRVAARGDTRWWGGGIWVRLEDPRTHRNVELNWYPRGSLFASRYTLGEAIDHLDFTLGVAPLRTLETVYRRLLKAGARPTRYSPSTTEGWMASVRDPDGIWITVGRQPTAAERRAIAKARDAARRKRGD
jgi:catechol 2,3-dioxygenase-like lactoylglutathione lyase family enzyme